MPAELWVVDTVSGNWMRASNSGQTVIEPSPGMVHPGVMYSESQLSAMAVDVNSATSNPRKSTYATMLTRSPSGGTNAGLAFSSLTWTPHPVPIVKRYQSTAFTDVGDSDLVGDSVAALTHAMIWRLTGNRANASKAAEILNAWSSTITHIAWGWPESATVAADGKLLAGWTASPLCRAAEILTYSGYTAGVGETALNLPAMKAMIRDIWVPILLPYEVIGQHNWYCAVIDGAMQAAVLLEIVHGKTTSAISEYLNYSRGTVNSARLAGYRMLDVHSTSQLISVIRAGIGL